MARHASAMERKREGKIEDRDRLRKGCLNEEVLAVNGRGAGLEIVGKGEIVDVFSGIVLLKEYSTALETKFW